MSNQHKSFIKKLAWELWDTAKLLIIALIIATLLKNTVVASAYVPTGSMEGTVVTGSRIFINKLAYTVAEPERGDIVSFYCPDEPDTLYLKRIIGLPGDTIEGIDGYVYINGTILVNDYSDILLNKDFGPFVVPEDSYFMLGDNRVNSWDSRYWDNPYVSRDAIIGKATIEFYPEVKVLE
ncbi:MAG: signal peptidase I [Lachnospiraceae bacterium]|nr:signal peptidase I [Lachnospiraceae bacterium]